MKSKYLVVDTTAFIENVSLQDIGEHILTVEDVINEVKNKRQLRHLASLTYDLEVKDVFTESITHVTEFSKKTGDFPSLSATDIKVIALTYQLEKQYVGTSHLRDTPVVKQTVDYTNKSVVSPTDIAGFYMPSRIPKLEQKANSTKLRKIETSTVTEKVSQLNFGRLVELCVKGNNEDSCDEFESAVSHSSDLYDPSDNEFWYDVDSDTWVRDKNSEEDDIIIINSTDSTENGDDSTENSDDYNDSDNDSKENKLSESDDDDYYNDFNDGDDEIDDNDFDDENSEGDINVESDTNDDDDDDSNWITPSNIKSIKQELTPGKFEEKSVTVGCVTTDFAIQNVLKQMGLNVMALDGRVIKEMRTFILRCYACFKTTSIMKKQFCPHCGNRTLKRVAVSLDESGNQQIHINFKRPLSAKGKRFSLPVLKTGKHAVNPRLVEDARRPHQKPSRLARTKTDALHPDYTVGVSPFALRDTHSKSAQLGFTRGKPVYKYWMQRNPNQPKKASSKKK